jgi:hypothetical protein
VHCSFRTGVQVTDVDYLVTAAFNSLAIHGIDEEGEQLNTIRNRNETLAFAFGGDGAGNGFT